MSLTTKEKQISNRILNKFSGEDRRRIRKLTDTLEETGSTSVSEVPIKDFKAKFLAGGTSLSFAQGTGLAAVGSAVGASLASTNKFTRQSRTPTTAVTPSTSAIAGIRTSQPPNLDSYLGTNSEDGGFEVVFYVGASSGFEVATARFFAGYWANSTAPTDVEPSSLVNFVGLAADSADTNMQIMHNDGSGTATKIDLGSSFPKPSTNSEHIYKVEIVAPGGLTVNYTVTELLSGAVAQGVINTDLPSATTGLGFNGYLSAGGTSAQPVFCLFGYYEKQASALNPPAV